jgi:hypothetical protein
MVFLKKLLVFFISPRWLIRKLIRELEIAILTNISDQKLLLVKQRSSILYKLMASMQLFQFYHFIQGTILTDLF